MPCVFAALPIPLLVRGKCWARLRLYPHNGSRLTETEDPLAPTSDSILKVHALWASDCPSIQVSNTSSFSVASTRLAR
jgi:hypothetical protein